SDDASDMELSGAEATPDELASDSSPAADSSTMDMNDSADSNSIGTVPGTAPVSFRSNKSKIASTDDVTWINERVSQMWADSKIKPSTAASDGEFIRRAYLDIVGTLPPAEEAAEFIKSRVKDKKSKLIMALLNSEDYAKYWSSIWSNLL